MGVPQMGYRVAEIQRETVREFDLRKNKQNSTSIPKTVLASAYNGSPVFWILPCFCQQLVASTDKLLNSSPLPIC